MKLLITGFKEFSGMKINPSRILVESLSNVRINSKYEINLSTALLPVDFEASGNIIRGLIIKEKPDVIIMTGVDLGKKVVTIEASSYKQEKYLNDDNPGRHPSKLDTQIDVERVWSKLIKNSFKLALSNDAGLFVCNHVYYVSNLLISQMALNTKCLFIHIPYPYPYYFNRKKITPKITIKEIRNTFLAVLIEVIHQELDDYMPSIQV